MPKRDNATPRLAMLEELRRYAPEYKRSKVLRAIDATFNQLLESMVQEGKLGLRNNCLPGGRMTTKGSDSQSIAKWDARVPEDGHGQTKRGDRRSRCQGIPTARQLARESVYLKPDIPGGKALIKEIDTIYPLVNVGVLQIGTVLDPTRIDNWASRRSGRLLYRTLFEMKGAGPEGWRVRLYLW